MSIRPLYAARRIMRWPCLMRTEKCIRPAVVHLSASRTFFNLRGSSPSEQDVQDEAARKRRVQELRNRISAWSITDPLHLRAIYAAMLARTSQDSDIISFTSQALCIGSYATTALVVAGTLGVDTTPLLAVAGSAGVALGFALRDFVSNLLSGN
jgi:hypothetical protein